MPCEKQLMDRLELHVLAEGKAQYLGQTHIMQIPAWGTEVNALATALLVNRIQSGDHMVLGKHSHKVRKRELIADGINERNV